MPPPTTKAPPASRPAPKNGHAVAPAALGLRKPTKTNAGNAIVINGVEGVGKTTIAASAPNPAILMAGRERGYETLYNNDLVPECSCAVLESWSDTLAQVDALANDPGDIKTLVLDALGGFERQCHDHVCQREYKGDWGEKGFTSYMRGYGVSIADWLALLAALDRLRFMHGTTVLLLSHAKIVTFKNPLGPDYDHFVADCHDKTWGVTAKWADAVFFYNFHTIVETDRGNDKKGKGIGGYERRIYTQRCDAYDAKNRFGMKEMIQIPDDPNKSWSTLADAIGGKAGA